MLCSTLLCSPILFSSFHEPFPQLLLHLINSFYVDVLQDNWFYWWRAVSATYYTRPNAYTLAALDKYRTLPIKLDKDISATTVNRPLIFPDENNGQCISMYVRGGDKAAEMALVPLKKYTDAIEIIMTRFLNTTSPRAAGTKGNPVIFIGTESFSSINETIAWGKENNFQVTWTTKNQMLSLHRKYAENVTVQYSTAQCTMIT